MLYIACGSQLWNIYQHMCMKCSITAGMVDIKTHTGSILGTTNVAKYVYDHTFL